MHYEIEKLGFGPLWKLSVNGRKLNVYKAKKHALTVARLLLGHASGTIYIIKKGKATAP